MTGINSIEVVLPLPIDKTFDYALSTNEFKSISIGSRVVVSFGKKKLYTAIVISKSSNKTFDYELKEIEYIVDDKPCVNKNQIKLFEWISNYYMCPIGKVYETALPKLLLIKSESIIEVINEGTEDNLSEEASNLFSSISSFNEISFIDIIKLFGKQSLKLIDELVLKNYLKVKEEIYDRFIPKTENIYELNHLFFKNSNSFSLLRSQNHKNIVSYFKDQKKNFSLSQNSLKEKFKISDAILNTLVKKNILLKSKSKIDRFIHSNIDINKSIELSKNQKISFNKIKSEVDRKRVVLFKGVTSSGKTEIYIELIKEIIHKKLDVLLLVPEIALTTQLVSRLEKFFPNNLHVYHSGINPNKRFEIWSDLIDSKIPKVVLGARSSIFLPLTNLGLIIVDEENEVSYKQFESRPLYNARDLAVFVSKQYQTGCVLASATPSIESFNNAINNKYSLIELNSRFGDFKSPELIFVDSKNEDSVILSDLMIKEIKLTLSENKQVLIFRNRRGYSTYLQCSACLSVEQCPNCDVSLTLHINQKKLKCHYCGFSKNESKSCNSCGLHALQRKGIGTQLVENEIKSIFPDVRVARLDYDSTRKKSSFKNLINDFENNEYQILVGTQMITKGLDFGNVSLVCVIESDFLLNYPDFRSHERYFQLIKQVSGRAGRSGSRGKVIIQTKNINHYVNRRIVENDDENFYKNQLIQRKDFNYPPFTRLIKIVLKSKKKEKLNISSKWLANSLTNISNIDVLGPEYPLVSRINNFYITNILLKIDLKTNLSFQKSLIKKILKKFNNYPDFRSVKVLIDVDPYN